MDTDSAHLAVKVCSKSSDCDRVSDAPMSKAFLERTAASKRAMRWPPIYQSDYTRLQDPVFFPNVSITQFVCKRIIHIQLATHLLYETLLMVMHNIPVIEK